MTKKNRGLLVSIVVGLVAILLLLIVLVLHAFGLGAASAETADGHISSQVATTNVAATTSQTMIMPDGSVMDMGPATAADTATASTVAPGSTMDTGHMGGAIDWQVIGLILALIAACVSLGTALNEYLRRQIAVGAVLDQGATGE